MSYAPAAVGLFPSNVMAIDRTPRLQILPPCAPLRSPARATRRVSRSKFISSIPSLRSFVPGTSIGTNEEAGARIFAALIRSAFGLYLDRAFFLIAIFQRTASLSKRPSRSGVPRLAVAGIRRIRHQLLASVKPSKQSFPFFFKNRPTVTGEEQRNTHERYMTQCQNR